VFSHGVVVFASDSAAFLALLNSCVHAEWAWKQSSKLKRDLRYTPSDCFETFPLPVHGELPDDEELDDFGERFHTLCRKIMGRDQIGLTTLYNRFHDPGDGTEGLQALRVLQTEIDFLALALYDWSDIDLDHDFRDVPYLPENDRHRFTISEEARLEILDRLGRLNNERYDEEVAAGLHDKKGGKKRKATTKTKPPGPKSAAGQPSLFQSGNE
jgi:hypothetical protein